MKEQDDDNLVKLIIFEEPQKSDCMTLVSYKNYLLDHVFDDKTVFIRSLRFVTLSAVCNLLL